MRELERPSTTREFAEQGLRQRVLSGALRPGERINEVALAEELRISRGPLREAIRGLSREGILDYRPHLGAFVREPGEAELAELYEVRIALETHALRIILRRNDALEQIRLSEMIDASEDRFHGDGRYPQELDFHASLLEATGVQMLVQSWRDLQMKLVFVRGRSAKEPARAREALGEHRELLASMQSLDVEGACGKLEEHLRRSLAHAVAAQG